jgi:hypothetical protein
MLRNKLHFCSFLFCFLLLASCNSAQSGYPIFLGFGKTISVNYSVIEIKTRAFKNHEMLSIGLNLEGKTICSSKKAEERLCTQELKSSYPNYETPKDLIFNPDKKYTDIEIKELKIKFENWHTNNVKEKIDVWYSEVEKQQLVDFQVIAIDSNNQEIPFVYTGSGSGYCSSENDNLCNQFSLDDKNSRVKTLEGIMLKAVKIKSVEGELKVSNIYVVGPYQRGK